MADDQTNPYTTMGMMGMMMPNPYINAAYKNKPLPIPGFLGTPTDAQGNPIQSFTDAQAAHDAWQPPAAAPAQGTTLNSAPANTERQMGAMYPGGPMVNQNPNYSSLAAGRPLPAGWYGNQVSNADKGSQGDWTPAYGGGPMQQAPQQAAAPAPQNPIDMRQAYLNALSNPGKVTTPGATMQPSKPLGTPNVLDAFLANHQAGPAAPAGGGYSNRPFFDTLSQLRSNA